MPTLVTTKELCEKLKVNKYWVCRQKNKAKNPLPYIYIGKNTVRYPLEKVMDWLNAGHAQD